MAVEVMVRISPRMFREDMTAFRVWLEETFPAQWKERAAPGQEDSLAAADFLLAALFTGMGEEFGKAAVRAIRAKLKELAERYADDDLSPDDADFAAVPEAPHGPGAGEQPEILEAVGSRGADDDAH